MAENWMLKAVISANAEGMLGTLRSVNVATRTTRKYLLDVGKSATNLAGQIGLPLGLIGGALSAFSVAGIQQAITGFATLTGQISDASKGLGITAEEYQRVTFIAGQSGVSAEAMGASMGKLNKNIAMAVAGKNKDFASLMDKGNIAMRNANGSIKSATELLPELAEMFKNNQNAALQARMGNTTLGKSWQALAPLLNDGKQGIDELTERYQKLGLTIDNNTVAAGEAFGDQMDQLKMVAQSYGNTITAKLLPALSPLIEKTILWAVENRDLITTNISAFITDMADSLDKVDWKGVINGIKDFVQGCKDLIEWIGGAKNALIALVFVMNIQAITAMIGLIGSIGRLGLAFGALALKALAPVAPLQTVTTGMSAANAKAAMLVNTVGRLSAAAGIAGAAFAGWEIGTWLNDNVVNPGVQKLTGDKDQTLGGWVYDKMNPQQPALAGGIANNQMSLAQPSLMSGLVNNQMSLAQPSLMSGLVNNQMSLAQPSLMGGNQTKVGGEIKVKFDNAPPGMRVEQPARTGPVAINADVGYRSYATGMP